jgi:hypothetical protein
VNNNWRPLLAAAELAGGGWPERAQAAATVLALDAEDAALARVLLLADLRRLFDGEPSGVLFTREILAALHKDETRPWPEWKQGKPITDRQLAALLTEFKIVPKTVGRRAYTDKAIGSNGCARTPALPLSRAAPGIEHPSTRYFPDYPL